MVVMMWQSLSGIKLGCRILNKDLKNKDKHKQASMKRGRRMDYGFTIEKKQMNARTIHPCSKQLQARGKE